MFTVYHNESPANSDTPSFSTWDKISKSNLIKVATVRTPNLNDVYRLTNHIDRAWWDNPEVVRESDKARSTSVGDLIVDEDKGKAYEIARVGFAEVKDVGEFFQLEEIV